MATRGRPRKPKELDDLEGNPGKRDKPPDVSLYGLPECPAHLGEEAAEYFRFIAAELGNAGVLKRLDSPLLAMLADLLAKYWVCSEANDIDGMCKIAAKVMQVGCRLALPPSERAALMAKVPHSEKKDPIEERYMGVVG
jgi:phage terminase small subunit